MTKPFLYSIIYIETKGEEQKNMREKLIERMIKVYGYEHQITIDFCRLCENWENTPLNDKTLKMLVEAHEEDPQF